MGVEWLDHPADAGFRAVEATLDAVFCTAADAVFSLMVDTAAVRPHSAYAFDVSAATIEDLLVDWLSDLLSQKELTRMIFSRFDLSVTHEADSSCRCVGKAWGEPIDRSFHTLRTEVKGISYLGLRVERVETGWKAQVIVDV